MTATSKPITGPAGIKPTDLPAPPQAEIRIARACADANVTSQQLAKIIGSDPVLTAELLRIVNSPFYGMQREIITISHAVTILGQRALRNLALCLSVRDAMKPEDIGGLDVSTYWEDALRRAVNARLLGQTIKMDPDECFTVGLLQDFGMLAMFHAMPQHAAHWDSMHLLTPDERYEEEKEIFGTTHDQVGHMLARAWGLPEDLAATMANHHACTDADPDNPRETYCKIAQCADWMAAVFTAADKATAISRCRNLVLETFGHDSETCDNLLQTASEEVDEAADALGLRVVENIRFEDVLREANKHLAAENLSYQELTWELEKTLGELEKTLDERDTLASELQKELELAREIQQSLIPKQHDYSLPIIGVNISAREVSGDFYDYFALQDGRIVFNLADVSGKGMNAALLMAKTCSLFRCLGKSIEDPAELMSIINTELYETSTRGMFVTMVGGVYEPANGKIVFVNAGHQPVLFFQENGKTVEIPAKQPPIGIMPQVIFETTEIDLGKGSLFIYTDGLAELYAKAFGESSTANLLGFFKKVLNSNHKERVNTINTEINNYKQLLHDDLTILMIDHSK